MSNLVNQSVSSLNVQTMSSREIADLTGKRHDNVMSDIKKMLLDLDLNAPDFSGTYKTAQGNEYQCFSLPKRESLILVSGYSVDLRAKIIDRWQELEQSQGQPIVNPAQLSRMQLLQLAMEAEEEKLALEAKVEEQAPKVEALERISEATGAVTLTNAAKILQQQPRKFNDWLHSIGWIYRRLGRNQWTAYQQHIKLGRLTHKVHAYIDGETGESKMSEQVMITPKGIAQLSEMLNLPLLSNMPLKQNAYLEARGC